MTDADPHPDRAGSRPDRTPAPGVRALRLLLGWAALCAVVLGWGRLLTGPLATSLGRWENDVSVWVAHRRTPTGDRVASVGTFLGDTVLGVVVIALVVVGFALWQRSLAPVTFGLVGYVGLLGVYLTATALDPRDRPPVRILDPGLVPDHSYPSGHVMTAMTIAGTLVLLTRRYARLSAGWVPVAALLPVLTCCSRVYQGAHHLTDVLTSVVVAAVWLTLVGATVLGPPRGGARA